MGSSGREGEEREPLEPDAAARARFERRAEALRSNLTRRKAQTRARDEARRDAPARDR